MLKRSLQIEHSNGKYKVLQSNLKLPKIKIVLCRKEYLLS
ncbi:unnamed protein product [Paramecium sonneborni]|uniref:Uncharacterized protein n=1 Tax=Paramecium sonneborni TaxID=65129 RepID=A0A8S1QBL1_9CILI|nr:unnamed protein product [Paramecium sonneborni]